MEREIQAVDARGRATGLVVTAGDDATVTDLRIALAARLGRPAGPLSVDGRPVADSVPLSLAGLVEAAVVTLDPDPDPPTPGAARVGDGALEIAVVGGPAAGAAAPLPADGELIVGRSAECGLAVADPEVSRRHVRVRATATAAEISDLGSRNGTARRGCRLGDTDPIELDEVFGIGESAVLVREVRCTAATVQTDPAAGVRRFNRPPRIPAPDRLPEVAVPAAPERPQGFRFPVVAVLLPLVAAGVCVAVFPGSRYFLLFLALSPLMAVANMISDRRGHRRDHKARMREYRNELAAADRRLGELARTHERGARHAHPDPAEVARIAVTPTTRLFERRPGDRDFLHLRLGLADQPVPVRLTGAGAAGHPVPSAPAVPVVADLAVAGVIGVAGPRASVLGVARAVLTQTAALHAPHDLAIVVLTGADTADDWDWATWLPHTLAHRPDFACRRLVGADRDQAEARVAELRRLVGERRAGAVGPAPRGPAPRGRRVLVVLDGARRLREIPGVTELLADGPPVGVYALCLDETEESLPDECRATAVTRGGSGTRLRVTLPDRAAEDVLDDVLADGLAGPPAAALARALAPLRVLGAAFGDDAGVPDTVRYLDLCGLGRDPEPAAVAARWAAQPGRRGTRVPLGIGPDGPVEIDLRRDGPHALIAGTSGAGKSELLQTLVAGLALANAPDALNVVLVDYKGGSAFADCRDLPHCVGLVTDLDGHLVKRALDALTAELRRRETILAAANAKDIEEYWTLTGGRLPRLVIVVDEFASLVEEVPGFVTGVVGIGMRGRSLGIHVVLATQRPGGVVNAELRANLNLRICLRVTGDGDSADVIDVPDAARISRHHPGRAYLRTGHGDLALLQTARIGWPRAIRSDADRSRVEVRPRTLADLGRPPARPAAEADTGADTDLSRLVAAIGKAADDTGEQAPAGPWLPPLPEVVTLAELNCGLSPGRAGEVAVPIGLADEPARQAQEPFVLDLAAAAPVAVAGMARSGRSTLLRTMAAAVAERSSPADVHLYALDYGSNALAPLAALPHCGAHVGPDEPDRVQRLVDLLTAEVARRQRVLAAGRYSSVDEQRAGSARAERLPYLVLLLDQYETFLARHQDPDGVRLVDAVEALLRRGPSVGILPVLATDRSGYSHRLGTIAATRVVLRHADPEHAAVYGIERGGLPREMPAGRAVVVPGGVEVQVALLDPDPDGPAQGAAVARSAVAACGRWDGLDPQRRPRRVDALPESITLADLHRLRPVGAGATPTTCVIGAGGDHLHPVDVDLGDGAFLVHGPARSGRSTALAAVVTTLAGRATGSLPVVLITPRPSPLRDLADLPGVADLLVPDGPGGGPDVGREFADDLAQTLDELDGPRAIVVDDAELLAGAPVDALLERLVRHARDRGDVVVAAATTEDLRTLRYRGWLGALCRSRHGLLLNPGSPDDGGILDVGLPRATNGGWPAGRGLLVRGGATFAVQVPVAVDPSRTER